MFTGLGQFIARYGGWVVAAWIALAVAVRTLAPAWDSVTLDGDFAYLPSYAVSVEAERLLSEAFPDHRTKSQIVLLAARNDRELDEEDLAAADSLALPFLRRIGAEQLAAAQRSEAQLRDLPAGHAAERERLEQRRQRALNSARSALDEAILIDDQLAECYHNRAIVLEMLGKADDAAEDRAESLKLDPQLAATPNDPLPRDTQPSALLGAWTRHNDFAGKQLASKDGKAVLIVLQLSSEFMAIDNVPLLAQVNGEIARVRGELAEKPSAGLELGVTGSAAIGADMLDSAAESLKITELLTVIFVVIILFVVYRAPMLVIIPMACIALSYIVATGLVAALTQVVHLDGFDWWTFKVFKTTKIFIVVILFGSGTDYCLFLIARYKEELEAGKSRQAAIEATLRGTGDAISASALTSILGLGMMFFAEFGKFSNSGLAIGLCLFVTLLACITFAPALLQLVAPIAFWPWGDPEQDEVARTGGPHSEGENRSLPWYDLVWKWVADAVLARPGLILLAGVAVMLPAAYEGLQTPVTYDLLSELAPQRPSKLGTELLRKHYPVGESGPVVVLAVKENARFDTPVGVAKIEDLTRDLYAVERVRTVRSLAEPLGDKPSKSASFRKRALRNHHLTKDLFLAQDPQMQPNTARFELILDCDPFSAEAFQTLAALEAKLAAEAAKPDSPWQGATFAFAGTTSSIRDLRDVTTRDTFNIEIYVLLAVYLVLLVIIRQTLMCTFLMVSVVFSFFVTMGITEWTFAWLYGETFGGIDWKVPLYLFVILVAIGQDYNIYLVTRVLEEQAIHGPSRGLHVAVVRTGSIITSCGLIMAGSFVAMMAGSLRAMVELGFALSLGVILDTMIIRPIIVPTFISLILPWMADDAPPPPAELEEAAPPHPAQLDGANGGEGHLAGERPQAAGSK